MFVFSFSFLSYFFLSSLSLFLNYTWKMIFFGRKILRERREERKKSWRDKRFTQSINRFMIAWLLSVSFFSFFSFLLSLSLSVSLCLMVIFHPCRNYCSKLSSSFLSFSSEGEWRKKEEEEKRKKYRDWRQLPLGVNVCHHVTTTAN